MRYIVIEKKLGVFVGQLESYAIYAKNEIFGVEKIVSFSSKKEATEFIEDFLNVEGKEFCIEEINSNNKYVSIKDVIKAGLGYHTYRMMDNIPMHSESVH